jgi:hypothetical protein
MAKRYPHGLVIIEIWSDNLAPFTFATEAVDWMPEALGKAVGRINPRIYHWLWMFDGKLNTYLCGWRLESHAVHV